MNCPPACVASGDRSGSLPAYYCGVCGWPAGLAFASTPEGNGESGSCPVSVQIIGSFGSGLSAKEWICRSSLRAPGRRSDFRRAPREGAGGAGASVGQAVRDEGSDRIGESAGGPRVPDPPWAGTPRESWSIVSGPLGSRAGQVPFSTEDSRSPGRLRAVMRGSPREASSKAPFLGRRRGTCESNAMDAGISGADPLKGAGVPRRWGRVPPSRLPSTCPWSRSTCAELLLVGPRAALLGFPHS